MARTTRTTGAAKAPAKAKATAKATAAKPAARRAGRKSSTAPAAVKNVAAAKRTRTTAKVAPATPAKAERKTQVRRTDAQKVKIGKTIISRMRKGETMSAIAADLKLYPFQAHQLVALVHVENGDVDKIEGKSEDVVLKRLVAAREKGDQYASFDYLQARSGINKVKIRKMFTDAGRTDLLADVRQSSKRQKASAARAKESRAKGAARKTATRKTGARRTRPAAAEPVAAKAKSTRTRATAAKAAAKVETSKAKPAARRRRTVKSKDEFDAKDAIDKGLAKVKAETPAAKPARKLVGAAKRSADRKVAAATPKRTRRPVNVPKGARPSAADPS